jgi:hypothetical protein
MPRKTRNLLTAGMKVSVGRGYDSVSQPFSLCDQIFNHNFVQIFISLVHINNYVFTDTNSGSQTVETEFSSA